MCHWQLQGKAQNVPSSRHGRQRGHSPNQTPKSSCSGLPPGSFVPRCPLWARRILHLSKQPSGEKRTDYLQSLFCSWRRLPQSARRCSPGELPASPARSPLSPGRATRSPEIKHHVGLSFSHVARLRVCCRARIPPSEQPAAQKQEVHWIFSLGVKEDLEFGL